MNNNNQPPPWSEAPPWADWLAFVGGEWTWFEAPNYTPIEKHEDGYNTLQKRPENE